MSEGGGMIELADAAKAYMEVDDIILVNRSKQSLAGEARLYFEISLAISMCFLGVTITDFQWWTVIVFIIFGLLAVFFAVRCVTHNKLGKLTELKGVFKIGD